MQTCIYFNLTFVVEMAGVEPASKAHPHNFLRAYPVY